MSTPDIHTQIDSLDGQNVDYSDPNLYSKLLGYDQQLEDAGQGGSQSTGVADQTFQGDAAQGAATTVDNTAAAGQSDNTNQGAATQAAATSDATAGATDQQGADQSQGIEGVATKDGKRIIPYAVLEHERREKQQLKDQLKGLQQQLQARAADTSTEAGDLADRAATDPNSLTDADLQQLEQDFPSLAKPLKVLRAISEKVEGLQQSSQAQAAALPTQQQATQAQAEPEDEQAAFDNGIADNPLVAKWMSEGGREWQRAVAIDRVLSADPENASLTYSQRFAKVQAMVAAEFGIQAPAAPTSAPAGGTSSGAKPANAAPAAPAKQPQTQQVMPTLTDLGGTGVSVSADPMAGFTPGQMVDAAMEMSEEQLRRMAGLSY